MAIPFAFAEQARFATTASTGDLTDLPIFYEYDMNFETGEMYPLSNGDFVLVKENDAIRVWIWKALQVERYKWYVYDWNYGEDFAEFLLQTTNRGLIETEIERGVRQALYSNPYITEVNKFSFEYGSEKLLTVHFNVITIYGEEVMSYNYYTL